MHAEIEAKEYELEQQRRNMHIMIPTCIASDALHDAIQCGGDGRDEALGLLGLPEIPGLNVLDNNRQTLLHDALSMSLPEVALKLLNRPDFVQVNARDFAGRTC